MGRALSAGHLADLDSSDANFLRKRATTATKGTSA
jgi:hypothetical protein